jgi:hypothetical protein
VSCRPDRAALVHRAFAGQAWQVAASNLTTIGSAGDLWPHLRVTYGPTPDRQTLG